MNLTKLKFLIVYLILNNKKRKVDLINTECKVIGKCMGPIKQDRILYKI